MKASLTWPAQIAPLTSLRFLAAMLVVLLTAMAAHHLIEMPGKRLMVKLAPLRHLAALVHPLREGRPT